MGFQVYNSQGQELQNLTGTAGGDLTGTYPNPTVAAGAITAAKLAAGSIVQVVEATSTTQTQIASTTYSDTGLSGSITPSSSSNKILVLVSQSLTLERNNNSYAHGYIQIVRGSTSIADFGRTMTMHAGTGDDAYQLLQVPASFACLDSPSSTTSVTYKTQGKVATTANNCDMVCQWSSARSTMMLLEIRA